MGLFQFLKHGRARPAAVAWRHAWEHAVQALDSDAVVALRAALTARSEAGEDVEFEDEMLQALQDVLALERDLADGTWPTIDTAHRVAAGERCHFSVPVSMPDEPAQPTGRLLLTSGRAAFAGGA